MNGAHALLAPGRCQLLPMNTPPHIRSLQRSFVLLLYLLPCLLPPLRGSDLRHCFLSWEDLLEHNTITKYDFAPQVGNGTPESHPYYIIFSVLQDEEEKEEKKKEEMQSNILAPFVRYIEEKTNQKIQWKFSKKVDLLSITENPDNYETKNKKSQGGEVLCQWQGQVGALPVSSFGDEAGKFQFLLLRVTAPKEIVGTQNFGHFCVFKAEIQKTYQDIFQKKIKIEEIENMDKKRFLHVLSKALSPKVWRKEVCNSPGERKWCIASFSRKNDSKAVDLTLKEGIYNSLGLMDRYSLLSPHEKNMWTIPLISGMILVAYVTLKWGIRSLFIWRMKKGGAPEKSSPTSKPKKKSARKKRHRRRKKADDLFIL